MVRRTRVRSSSVGDMSCLDRRAWEAKIAVPESPPAAKKAALDVSGAPRGPCATGIWTLGSPPSPWAPRREEEEEAGYGGRREGFGSFFEKCFSCHKKIGENVSVFMSGEFRAFCSEACRDRQHVLDEKERQAS